MTVAVAEREAKRESDAATSVASDALAAGLADAARHDGLWLIALPAPIASPAALLASAPARDVAVLWEPRAASESEGQEWLLAGAGAAAEIRASGPDRIERVREAARALWARVGGLDQLARVGAPAPRLLGGLSFAPGAWTAEWSPLGDAWFALPRWTYARRGDAAWLILAVLGREADGGRWQRERAAIEETLAAPLPTSSPRHVASVSEIDEAAWHREIDDIRAAIRGGRLAKVVAARPSVVELGEAIEPAVVLAALADRHPDCTRFAVRTGGVTFVGATPERLVRQRDRVVETDALAGSIARGRDGSDDEAAARLLASAKDRWEHDLVVRGIADTLAPRCAELDVPATPSVRPLRHVLHMHTPVRGRLAESGHVLDLVAALHPTPAVGGTPRAEAVAWIAEREPPRGWYASPVGWFDADGDGDFAVAIRSGLIAGHRAQIWAGAGIVGDSDPDAELAEVRLKQRALLGALGVL